MGFPGTFARLKSRLSYMAKNKAAYGPNGPENQAPGRSASMLARTASRGRHSAKSDPPVAIALGYRWPMRSNLQKLNGFNALFKSAREQFVCKCDLNLPNMCFQLSIWPNGHRESHKYEFVR